MGKGFWIGTIIVVIILGITAGIIVHVYGDESWNNCPCLW